MVVKNQYGMCVVDLPVCIHIYKLTSAIRIIYCVLLVIVHVDGKYFFAELQICHTLVLRHSQRSLCCSFPTTNERCKGLNSAPPTYLCSKSAGSQRNRRTQRRRWRTRCSCVLWCMRWCTSRGDSFSHLVLPVQDRGRYIWLKDQAAEQLCGTR